MKPTMLKTKPLSVIVKPVKVTPLKKVKPLDIKNMKPLSMGRIKKIK